VGQENIMRVSKYIGAFRDYEDAPIKPVTDADVQGIIADNRQFGTARETRIACMRILDRGDWLTGRNGFSVRRRTAKI
jgi:hypothetical protein